MHKDLPPLFVERLKKIIPSDAFETILSSFEKVPSPAFRLHHKDANKETVIAELAQKGFDIRPVEWQKEAFRLLNKSIRELQETAAYQNNHIYIQGIASMLPVIALNPQPGENILDLCAAPGSKTGQILRQMQNRGHLTANEKIKNRFFKLKNNLDAQGYSNFDITLKPGELYCKIAPNTFDRILLDSPCSSEGRFSTEDPDSFKYWSSSKIKEMVFKQRALFKSAFLALKPGGTMVYATCTYAPEENEGMLDWALGKTDDQMEILEWTPPVSNWMAGVTEWEGKTFSAEVKKARRILPNDDMTAFFIALIRKKD